MSWSPVVRSAGDALASVARVVRPFTGGISVRLSRVDAGTRRFLASSAEALRIVWEFVLVCAGTGRDYVRSTVLLRRLRARRAAVIYSAGCAALGGQDRRFEHARAELRLLDELIAAASSHTTFAFAPGESAAAAPAEAPTEEIALTPCPPVPA